MGISYIPPVTMETERQCGTYPQAPAHFVGASAAVLVGMGLYQATHLCSKVERQASEMNAQPTGTQAEVPMLSQDQPPPKRDAKCRHRCTFQSLKRKKLSHMPPANYV